jgi:transmembrane sensor
MDLNTYDLDDFLADESFQNWILHKDPESGARWEEWLRQYPAKRATAEEAAAMLRNLPRTERPVPARQVHDSWRGLSARINADEALASRNTIRRSAFRQSWFRVAAAITALLLVAFAYWTLRDTRITYSTPYGTVAQVTLPDGSVVTLNGNSTLRLHPDWTGRNKREVWLEGEAFFAVTRQVSPGGEYAKFTVHSSRLAVDVLGTKFNVTDRRGRTRVVLNEGKVSLRPEGQTAALTMQPGELAELTGADEQITTKIVNPENYSSWTRSKLTFDNTPLGEVAGILEETYGLSVEIRNPALLNQTVTGSLPSDNAQILLEALSQSFELKITRQGNRVIFHPTP